jgi:hypothetical protein
MSVFDLGAVDLIGGLTKIQCKACADAAKSNKQPWFKDRGVGVMEEIGHTLIGPALEDSCKWFRAEIDKLFSWAEGDDDRHQSS